MIFSRIREKYLEICIHIIATGPEKNIKQFYWKFLNLHFDKIWRSMYLLNKLFYVLTVKESPMAATILMSLGYKLCTVRKRIRKDEF